MAAARFDAGLSVEIENGVLTASGDLDWRSEEVFQDGCRRLFRAEAADLTVDMTDAAAISSSNMSFLVSLHYQAAEQGRTLHLRVGPEVARVFDHTRLRDLVGMNVEKVERSGRQ